jgi:predicted Rossmann-fold nucleotide-binding protein
MKIFVGGSLRDIPAHEDLGRQFVQRMGELIVEREHILLTGCRGSLDKTIAEAAGQWLERNGRDARKQIISYRLKNDEPAHRVGRIQVSRRTDWELTHPDLDSPEQIAEADVTIFVAGGEGTFFAANWARIAGKPVLGVGQFGGAGHLFMKKKESSLESAIHILCQ